MESWSLLFLLDRSGNESLHNDDYGSTPSTGSRLELLTNGGGGTPSDHYQQQQPLEGVQSTVANVKLDDEGSVDLVENKHDDKRKISPIICGH